MDPASLLQKHFVCDGHADTLARVAFSGGDFVSGEGTEHFHINWSKMKTGGVNLQFMAVFIPPEIPRHQGTVTALWIAQFGHRIRDELGGQLSLVTNKKELAACRKKGNHFLLTLEGASPLLGDLDVLELFHRFGVRSVGLTHNHNNAAAGGCKPPDGNFYGLTEFGRGLVTRMEEMQMLVDCAHLSRKGFYDLMNICTRPVVNTHCCCAHFIDIERNLSDEQMRLIADTGGLVAITYVPEFLVGPGKDSSSHDVYRHIQHAAEVVGIDHVALGSDFDGVRFLPGDISGPEEVSNVVARMQDAGWHTDDIAKVLGGNWYRLLKDVLPD